MDVTGGREPQDHNQAWQNEKPPQRDQRERRSTAAGSSHHKSHSSGHNHQARNTQAGFVQKLFNMLEDERIDDAICWAENGETFNVYPGTPFQSVLADYFKHNNAQSFVRQLNMYGFHKVNDVFQGNGAGDAHLWEFRHGDGIFRRGDRDSIREVKRRASKHTLDKREAAAANPLRVPYHALPTNSLGPAGSTSDTLEDRLARLEHQFFEQHAAFKQSEYLRTQLAMKCDVLTECVAKGQKVTQIISNFIATLAPEQRHQLHHSIAPLNVEIDEQLDNLRSTDNNYVPFDRRLSTASSSWEGSGPISPYQSARDESRRQSVARRGGPRGGLSRSAAASPRRLSSMSQATMPANPNARLPPPPVPGFQNQNPLAASDSSPLVYPPRRHTSADIRDNAGWRSTYNSAENLSLPSANMTQHYSPYGSSNGSAQWPSSPGRQTSQGEQQLRESLDRYQIDSRNASTASTASDSTVTQSSYPSQPSSQQDPPQSGGGFLQPGQNIFGNVQEGSLFNQPSSGGRSLFNGKDMWSHSSSSTRRSSMAHILNPADTAEREDEDDVAPEDRSKRKRVG